MPAKKYIVDLNEEERQLLQQLISRGQPSRGKPSARAATHARILLKASRGCADGQIVQALSTSAATVEQMRQRFVEESLEAALRSCLEIHYGADLLTMMRVGVVAGSSGSFGYHSGCPRCQAGVLLFAA